MKNLLKFFGIIAMVAVMVVISGCATASSVGGTTGPHGFFTGNGASSAVTVGATEIASYSVILGIIDSGYEEYVTKINAAVAEGKQVSTVTKWAIFTIKTTAYAK